ncbi:MAG: hypothetical protein E6G56_13125 [Actinobacteria bacterium]|nr:MAG: hypothetical protein E6G56_13125 [Actinomycetota bacterium]
MGPLSTRRAPASGALASALATTALAAAGGCGGSSQRSGASAPSPPARSGSTSPAGPAAPRSGRFIATLATPAGPHPKVGVKWPITIYARTRGGRPLRGKVTYQFLFGGAIVARRGHHRFTGSFHDRLDWPSRSVGLPLTFRAVVSTPLGQRNLDYPVVVQR